MDRTHQPRSGTVLMPATTPTGENLLDMLRPDLRRGVTRQSMARSQTTTERGYGYLHQRQRATLLPAALGTHCPGPSYGPRSRRCTGLMVDPKRMHLDHTVARALGGKHGDRIICAPCNTGSGARLGNALRRARGRRRTQSRSW